MSKDTTGSEGSSYWNQVGWDEEGERPTANPDLLSELDAIFPQKVLTSEQEEQYNLYLKASEKVKFTNQQKVMWNLFSLKCYSVTRIAQHLGLDKSTVSKTLKTAIEKLKIECEKERVKQFSNTRDVCGFQPNIKERGHNETDDLMKKKLEQHKDEIEAFYKEHPELREGRKPKNEDK